MSEAIGEGQGSLFAGYHSLYKSIQAGGVMMRIKIKINHGFFKSTLQVRNSALPEVQNGV